MTYNTIFAQQLDIIREQAQPNVGEAILKRRAEERAQWLFLRQRCKEDLYFLGTEVLGFAKIKDKRGKKRIDEKLHRRMAEEILSDLSWALNEISLPGE